MTKKHASFILGIVTLLVLSVFFMETDHPLPRDLKDPLATKVTSFDGTTWQLKRFAGKPMVVNFWASWCAPCLEELKDLSAMSKEVGDKVVFVGLTVDSPAEDVLAIVKRFNLTYPLAQTDLATADAWNAESIPSTYILDKTGKIIASFHGPVNERTLRQALAPFLKD